MPRSETDQGSLNDGQLLARTPTRSPGRVRLFSAGTIPDLITAVSLGREGADGPVRLAWVSQDAVEDERQSASALRALAAAAESGVTRPFHARGLHFRHQPIGGELAFVYTFAAAAYQQMGHHLLRALPGLSERDELRLAAEQSPPSLSGAGTQHPDYLEQLRQVFFLADAHTRLSRDLLGLRPAAAIGLSSGEPCALMCLRLWDQPDKMLAEIAASGLHSEQLGGKYQAVERSWRAKGFSGAVRWSSYRVLRPLEQVRAALSGEPLAHLLIIHSLSDCLIGGEQQACERAVARLGPIYCILVEGTLAVHCPEVEHFASTWKALHRRPVYPIYGVRFYSNGINAACKMEPESIADALLRQGLETIDLPTTILRAWQDGVRVFLEHGPRGMCTEWIGQILNGREHVAVSLDRMDEAGDWQALNAAAQLAVAGFDVNLEALNNEVSESAGVIAGEPEELHEIGPGSYQTVEPSWKRSIRPVLNHEDVASTTAEDSTSARLSSREIRLDWLTCLPTPPLLLIDRMADVDAGLSDDGRGSISTETDVPRDSWYLCEGHMPAGIVVESGQAHRLLFLDQDTDAGDRGGRVYRLLDIELTFHGSLPGIGDTLRWVIRSEGQARLNDLCLVSFNAECRIEGLPRLSVRNAKAGFFTHQEMAVSAGVRWHPEHAAVPRVDSDPPLILCSRSVFCSEHLRAFSCGDAFECFGPGFEMAATHNRTPRLPEGKLLLLDHVTHFDPAGGPWRRGYLRAILPVTEESWFFDGCTRGDPHMSTSLLLEGCLQAMAFYLAAVGCAVEKDGWRFEPAPDTPFTLSFRGQVVPSSRQVVWELYVRSLNTGPVPRLYADVVGLVDGLRAFHVLGSCQLSPDWLLDRQPELLENYRETKPVAHGGGIVFSYPAILAAAWGKPSEVFGAMYLPYDGGRRIPRLPAPPYQFITRVSRLEGATIGVPKVGAYAELEYDIPADAWYFAESASPSMPLCVLLEAVLQPCGWLAVYLGCSVNEEHDLMFRNLDGQGTVVREIPPGSRCLTTKVRITQLSQAGGMSLVHFDVDCEVDGAAVFSLKTSFGLFHPHLLIHQAGMPLSDSQRAFLDEPCSFSQDLRTRPERFFRGQLHLPDSRLLMLDRVSGFWPQAGAARLGRLRGEKDVSPRDWFFKAHFFQDPVQPGSLGVQALLQLLQFYVLENGLDVGISNPRFQPIALGTEVSWKYRGQVLPLVKKVVSEIEIIAIDQDESGACIVGNGQLYADGKRIYEIKALAMQVVSGSADPRQDQALQEIVFT